MTRDSTDGLDGQDMFGWDALAAGEPVGDGPLRTQAELFGHADLSTDLGDCLTERLHLVHGRVYITEVDVAASTQSDIRRQQTERMPKTAPISDLWKRFEAGCAELKPPKATDQETIRLKMGVGQSTVSNWKRGEKKPPIERGIELAAYADLCVQYLYKGQGPRRPWGDMSRPLAKLVNVWEDLNPPDRDKLLEYAELLLMRQSVPEDAASQNVTPIRKSMQKPRP